MQKRQNLLTKNEKYVSLLRIIGRSSKALTKSEIKEKMINSSVITKEQGSFVYEMIRDLRQILSTRKRTFFSIGIELQKMKNSKKIY